MERDVTALSIFPTESNHGNIDINKWLSGMNEILQQDNLFLLFVYKIGVLWLT